MNSEIVYDYEMLHERFHAAHQRGGLLVLPVIHLGDTPESFEDRRAAVESWMIMRGIEFDVVLGEFIIIDTEQYVRAHEYITGHLVQRGEGVGGEDVQRITTGVCRAIQGVMALWNVPVRDGVTLLTNENGIIRLHNCNIRFDVDSVLNEIQNEYWRRVGKNNDLILIFLGLVVDGDCLDENNNSK